MQTAVVYSGNLKTTLRTCRKTVDNMKMIVTEKGTGRELCLTCWGYEPVALSSEYTKRQRIS